MTRAMESVPGAIATGWIDRWLDAKDRCDRVAIAPRTDLTTNLDPLHRMSADAKFCRSFRAEFLA